jgi:hypothetical protein
MPLMSYHMHLPRQAMHKAGCLNAAGFLLSCIGCLLTMIPYVGILFLPVSLLGSLLVLSSSMSTAEKITLVIATYVVPVVFYVIIASIIS